MTDVLVEHGLLFLGSRLKRLAERMQSDVARIAEREGLPIQPSQYPVLATLDRGGAMTIGQIASALGLSQPAVTRTVARLQALGLLYTVGGGDQRQRRVTLSAAGADAMQRSRRSVWPMVETAVADLLGPEADVLLDRIGAIETALGEIPLDRRGPAGGALAIRDYAPELAQAFHDINAEWIAAMFALEPTDREVLENPEARIVAPGGDILFVERAGVGIVGTCALQRTGEAQFELTKMGVTAAARGSKAGEFLLRAMLHRAEELGAETLYLLTSSRCAAAIHLYEKVGFVHDAQIMRDFGARYARCDVAMRYVRRRNGTRGNIGSCA